MRRSAPMRITASHAEASQATLLGFWAAVENFRTWEGSDQPWPAQFMRDSELNGLGGSTPIDDL